jgi:WD40 repeat protein
MAEVLQGEGSSGAGPLRQVEYDAFLSYAHRDKDVTSAIQKGLHQIGRRVGQLRALRVFRDDTNLTANPDLWAKITEALDGSRFMIVVLSPQSASSHWVNEEIGHWLAHHGHQGLMLVLAEGHLQWNAQEARFDPEHSDAAPPVLTQPGSLPTEPLFIDVRDDAPWELRSLVFRDKVTSLAAPIHGKPKDDLSGEDLREQRRFRRLRGAAIAALAVLTVVSVVTASIALVQRGKAIREARDALAAQLDTEASTIFSRFVGDSDVHALADTLAAQRIRSNPSASRSAFYTAASTLNTTRVIVPTANSIVTAALSRDGHTLATAGSDNRIRLWSLTDPDHPEPLGQPLTGPTSTVVTLALSPDGRVLASAGNENSIRFWDIADPARPRPLGQPLVAHTNAILSVAFSPDARTLASSSLDRTVRLWNVTDPAHPTALSPPLFRDINDRLDTHVATTVAFTPDGRTLAASWTTAGGDAGNFIALWGLAEPTHPDLLSMTPNDRTSEETALAFGPDGHTLALGSRDGTIQLWQLTDPAGLQPLGAALTGHNGSISQLAFSADGHTLASAGSDTTVRLWDLTEPESARPLGEPLTGHTDSVTSLVFAPDGHSLVSTGLDANIRLWDLDTALPLRGPRSGLASVAFGAGGHTLASGADNTATIWLWQVSSRTNVKSLGELRAGAFGPTGVVAFSPQGHTLAATEWESVQLWNLSDSAHPLRQDDKTIYQQSVVQSVAFSPDGHTLAAGDSYGTIQLWDVTDPNHPAPRGAPPDAAPAINAVSGLAFSPDGRILAAGYQDRTIRLWDLTDMSHPRLFGRPVQGHTAAVNSVAFGAGGHTLASGSSDHTVRLWDLTDITHPAALGRPLRGHTGGVLDVTFRPDGDILASASGDRTIRLWDLTDPSRPAQLGQPLTGHTADVASVAFSPDGHELASGSGDGTVRLWPTPDDATVASLCSKLTSNISHHDWHDWISPTVGYITLCPNLPVPRE